MDNAIEQVKVIGVAEKKANDGKTTFSECTGMTHQNQVVIFYRPAGDAAKVNDIYYMYWDIDKYRKAVIKFRKG